MTIRERELGLSPVAILGVRLLRIDWGGCYRPKMPSVDRWWREQTSAYAEGFANVLKDFWIRQVRAQRRSAPALMESGLECSISGYIYISDNR